MTENITSDLQVNNLYKEINETYNYYQKHENEYIKISENSTKKANELNMDIINKTWNYLIIYFNKKIYEKNSKNIIDKFLDKIISMENNVKTIL